MLGELVALREREAIRCDLGQVVENRERGLVVEMIDGTSDYDASRYRVAELRIADNSHFCGMRVSWVNTHFHRPFCFTKTSVDRSNSANGWPLNRPFDVAFAVTVAASP